MNATANANAIAPDNVRRQLDKILRGATFLRSKRLGRFLSFTVEQYLEGRQNSLKEYLVGVEVFNKLESFDPRIDSIVRVEARRLRSKLDRYYQTEGRDDETIIQFRKGSYVPIVMHRDDVVRTSQATATDGRPSKRGIAVTRFSNLTAETAHDCFCAGLTDDLINALTKVDEIRVFARSGGPDGQRPEYALEGSVRKQGDRLRVSVQLVDVPKNFYVWSETYEREVSDVFAVQDEITRSITAALRKRLVE